MTAVTWAKSRNSYVWDDGPEGWQYGFNSDQSTGSDALAVERGGTTGPMFGLEPNVHRIFDFVLAAMGVMLFPPILLITSIAIKLESRGPIFVREFEFGYNNRVIKVLKFRLSTPLI